MKLLCDTNVLSELARREPNTGVLAWASRIRTVGLSVVTVEEIVYGLTLKPRPRIRAWFETFLQDRVQVLPVSQQVAEAGAQLRGELGRQGSVRSQADMLIAGTALVHGLTLVTGNVRDFDGCRIPLLNPFL